MSLNIIFAGTPSIATTLLRALIDSNHTLLSVLTQPDKPKGRGQKISPSPIKELAIDHNIPVLTPNNLKDDAIQQTLRALKPDVMIVVAYGMILPQEVLTIPKYGCINVHYSLLPKWRGAAPIQRAIEAGDTESGVSIMQMDRGLDTGPILAVSPIPILPEESSTSLYDKLAKEAPDVLLKTLAQLETPTLRARPQNSQNASYAKKLTKAEADINWSANAKEIVDKIRAFNAWPVAQSSLQDKVIRFFKASVTKSDKKGLPGEIVEVTNEVLIIATGGGHIAVSMLQLPGKKVMPFSVVINAYQALFKCGNCFV